MMLCPARIALVSVQHRGVRDRIRPAENARKLKDVDDWATRSGASRRIEAIQLADGGPTIQTCPPKLRAFGPFNAGQGFVPPPDEAIVHNDPTRCQAVVRDAAIRILWSAAVSKTSRSAGDKPGLRNIREVRRLVEDDKAAPRL